jgi:hypothetical protein
VIAIFWHEFVLMHRQEIADIPAYFVHGGQRPHRRLISCSCGKAWVRR